MNLQTWASLVPGLKNGDGQCVALVEDYMRRVLAIPWEPGNAVDFLPPFRLPRRTWVSNQAFNSPPAGAIVVWRGNVTDVGIGPFGHIAVALVADAATLLSLDQNWPPGSPPRLVAHSYHGVQGWWR